MTLAFNSSWSEHREVFETFKKLRPYFYDKIKMGYLDTNETEGFKYFAYEFGITTSIYPVIGIYDVRHRKPRRYSHSLKDLNEESIMQFYKEFH